MHRGYAEGESVWINMDETALPLHVGGRHGYVHGLPNGTAKQFATRASLHERRAHITLLASCCTDPNLQRKLPQFLLPNVTGKKRVWKEAIEDIAGEPPVVVLPDSSGWVNTEKLKQLLNTLSKVLKKEAPGKKIVLVWDCCVAHMTPAILQHARAKGIRVLMVPAKLTHVLQVLDFGVFATFKKTLHEAQVQRLLDSGTGTHDMKQWIRTSVAAIQRTFGDLDAAHHFHKAGQHKMDAPYRRILLDTLCSTTWRPTSRALTVDELWYLLGRRQRAVHPVLFAGLLKPAAAAAAEVPKRPKRLASKTTL